jgi:hypothetical protein
MIKLTHDATGAFSFAISFRMAKELISDAQARLLFRPASNSQQPKCKRASRLMAPQIHSDNLHGGITVFRLFFLAFFLVFSSKKNDINREQDPNRDEHE